MRAMRIASVGHAVFAATFVALGLLGLVEGSFAPIWQPVGKDVPARELLAYLCALVPLVAGIGMVFRRTASGAVVALLALLLAWLLLFRLLPVLRAPGSMGAWYAIAETSVYVSGAGALWGWLTARGKVTRAGRILYGLAMIPFGIGHFSYLKETASLVPQWLPWHTAFAVGTGISFIAAGVAIVVGRLARAAAVLSAVQMGLFTLLVWVPIAMDGPNAFQWSEFVISWTLTACAWGVADSYRPVGGVAVTP